MTDYKAFVSSTYTDLKSHRAHVIRALRSAGFFVDPMEDWTSSADEPAQFSTDRMANCHLCVLLVARRRGHVPSGDMLSITQQEYSAARNKGIDVLPYLLDDAVPDDDWPWEERDEVRKWIAEVKERHGVEWFRKTPNTLKIEPALTRWINEQGPKTALRLYLENVKQVHGVIQFVGLPQLKDNRDAPIDQLYVEPAVAGRVISADTDPDAWPETTPILDALAEHKKLVLLGDPGSGKSTMTSWLAWQLAAHHDGPDSAFTKRLGKLIPLPMTLRELDIKSGITWDSLLESFVSTPMGRLLTMVNLKKSFDDGNALIVLDGLDEIGNPQIRRELRDEVRQAMLDFADCRWLLTSRIVGYDEVRFDTVQKRVWADAGMPDIEDIDVYETKSSNLMQLAARYYAAPFDDDRVDQFAHNWFVLRAATEHQARTQAGELLGAIRSDEATTKLGRIPNLLTMMALIYRIEAQLPNGRALLYDKIAQAYLATIDGWRKIYPRKESEKERKRWLARIGFEMQRARSTIQSEAHTDDGDEVREIFASGDEVRGWVADVMWEHGAEATDEAASEFVDYLAKRSGLLLPRGQNEWAFLHLSFQEYFAACYLQNQIASPFWMTNGTGVADGTLQGDLATYARQSVWTETLVFLVELAAADDQPMWLQPILDAMFGEGFRNLQPEVHESPPSQADLLARLAVNPHASFSESLRADAIQTCVKWEIKRRTAEQSGLWRGEPSVFVILLGTPSDHQRAATWDVIVELAQASAISRMNLENVPITDLSPLARLTDLTALNLDFTRVENIAPLAETRRLKELWLQRTLVTDISPLEQLDHLETLVLQNTRVSDLYPIATCHQLQHLYLAHTPVSDLLPVSGMSKLSVLILIATNVSDLSPLAELKSLTHLSLSGTQVSDLKPLSDLDKLEVLGLDGTPITDLSPLREMPSLERLEVSGTHVSDLSPISLLPQLIWLHVNHTAVTHEQIIAFNSARKDAGLKEVQVVR